MISKKIFQVDQKAVFEKTVQNHRYTKLVTTERRRNYLVLEANYNATIFFSENLLAIAMERTRILMNKPVYLSLTIIEMNKTVMYEA